MVSPVSKHWICIPALRMLLKTEGYRTEMASSPSGIMQCLERHDYEAILMDLNYARDTTSGQKGLDLRQLR